MSIRVKSLLAAFAFAIASLLHGCAGDTGESNSIGGARTGAARSVDWPVYGGSAAADRYSPLDQINRSNIAQLTEVWRFETGRGALQTNPLVIDGVLYAYTPLQKVIALDAAAGQLKWQFDPGVDGTQPARGLSYWTDGKERRLFVSSDHYLCALDLATGRLLDSFGEGGKIDLRKDLGRDPATIAAYATSPGVIYKDVIIVGFRTSEDLPAAPGAIRAYDVRTGKLRWIFNFIPRPGEAGHDTWPTDAWKSAGGANAWPGLALDEKRGIIYAATGSASFDFYGADRKGDNLFANSLVAVSAETGKRLWHFQAVHHDVWDRDFPSQPVLLTVTRAGRRIDAVAQTSKQGFVFLFDRVTGEPLFPIEERAMPQDPVVPGEHLAPTQPIPLKPAPFARQRLTADLLTTRTPQAHAAALKEFNSFCSDGPFTPLCLNRQTVIFPGYDGGAEWGGPAIDRNESVIYINSNDVAWLGGLTETSTNVDAGWGGQLYQYMCAMCHGVNREGAPPEFPSLVDVGSRLTNEQIEGVMLRGKGRMPGFPQFDAANREALVAFLSGRQSRVAPEGKTEIAREVAPPATTTAAPRKYTFTGYKKFVDIDGYPAVKPPWGTLNAIDLNTGEYLWKVPLGKYPALAAQGMKDTGTENYGGPIVTAGGVVVIGATIFDRQIRAFHSRSGHLLWEHELPYAGNATPVTYMVGGRQYIVIATSGQRDRSAAQGSAYVAFALPPQ